MNFTLIWCLFYFSLLSVNCNHSVQYFEERLALYIVEEDILESWLKVGLCKTPEITRTVPEAMGGHVVSSLLVTVVRQGHPKVMQGSSHRTSWLARALLVAHMYLLPIDSCLSCTELLLSLARSLACISKQIGTCLSLSTFDVCALQRKGAWMLQGVTLITNCKFCFFTLIVI